REPAVLLALGAPDARDPRTRGALPARARDVEARAGRPRRRERRAVGAPAPRGGPGPLPRPSSRPRPRPPLGARGLLPPQLPRERPHVRGARRPRLGGGHVGEVPRARAPGLASRDAARAGRARRAEDAAPAALPLQHAERDRGAPEAEAGRGRA